MIEQLKDLSKLIVIPAAVLYFFGFICITAYLARFGIVTFDIVNARFLAAGFFPAVSLAIASSLAWFVLQRFGPEIKGNRQKRLELYAGLYLFTFFTSEVMTRLLNLGRFTPRATDSLIFAPPFKGWIGDWITDLQITGDVGYLIKWTFYLAAYASPILLVVFGVRVLRLVIRRLHTQSHQEVGPDQIALDTDPDSKPERSLRTQKLFKAAADIAMPPLDIIAVCAILATLWFSLRKLSLNTFDFDSFDDGFELESGLFFAWLFSSVFSIAGCLSFFTTADKQLSFMAFLDQAKHPFGAPTTIQQAVIPFVVSILAFGAVIFPRIPYALGGGEPRPVSVKTTGNQKQLESGRMFLIGESAQFVFLVNASRGDRKAMQVNKSIIAFIDTRRDQQASDGQPELPATQPDSQP